MFYTLLDDCAIVSQACLESLISKKISGNGFGIFFFLSYWHFSLKLWVKNIIIIEHAFFCQKTLIFLPTNTQFLFKTYFYQSQGKISFSLLPLNFFATFSFFMGVAVLDCSKGKRKLDFILLRTIPLPWKKAIDDCYSTVGHYIPSICTKYIQLVF